MQLLSPVDVSQLGTRMGPSRRLAVHAKRAAQQGAQSKLPGSWLMASAGAELPTGPVTDPSAPWMAASPGSPSPSSSGF